MVVIKDFDHLVLHVRNLETSAAWYQKVLGMKRHQFKPSPSSEMRQSVTFGDRKINLRPIDSSAQEWFTSKSPYPGTADLCFITEQHPETVVEHFRRCGADIVAGPVIKQGARGKINSVYTFDPDGNLIEVSSYGSADGTK